MPITLPAGVKRAHLLDARLDGGLLLELYSRDGVGTMISADFYEGIRKARPADLDAIQVCRLWDLLQCRFCCSAGSAVGHPGRANHNVPP